MERRDEPVAAPSSAAPAAMCFLGLPLNRCCEADLQPCQSGWCFKQRIGALVAAKGAVARCACCGLPLLLLEPLLEDLRGARFTCSGAL